MWLENQGNRADQGLRHIKPEVDNPILIKSLTAYFDRCDHRSYLHVPNHVILKNS